MADTPIIPITLIVDSQGCKWKAVIPCLQNPNVEQMHRTWSARQAVVLGSRNLVLEVWGETGEDGVPKTEKIRATLLDIGGNAVKIPYTVLRRRWTEVVRVDNQGSDTSEFYKLRRWHLGGFSRLGSAYLQRKCRGMELPRQGGRDAILPPGDDEQVLHLDPGVGFALCRTFNYHGNYEAYYLMRSYDEPLV